MSDQKPYAGILVVSDVDGTLLFAEEGMSPRNREAIEKFTRGGGHFTIASGRSADSVRRVLGEYTPSAPAILYNGGLVYDFEKEKPLYRAPLPDSAKEAFEIIRRRFPQMGAEIMPANLRIYVANASEYTQKHIDDEGLAFTLRVAQKAPEIWLKCLFACAKEEQPQLHAFAQRLPMEGFYCIATAPIYYELMPEGVNKGSTLQKLCNYLGYDIENVYAIGDYYNDIDLLKAAGHGIAVENAKPEVKAAAERLVAHCREGGVAEALEWIMEQATAERGDET